MIYTLDIYACLYEKDKDSTVEWGQNREKGWNIVGKKGVNSRPNRECQDSLRLLQRHAPTIMQEFSRRTPSALCVSMANPHSTNIGER